MTMAKVVKQPVVQKTEDRIVCNSLAPAVENLDNGFAVVSRAMDEDGSVQTYILAYCPDEDDAKTIVRALRGGANSYDKEVWTIRPLTYGFVNLDF